MTSPVHVGRAFESLRNSDFDTVSAIGEVIDNSIQAKAKNIRIKIKKTETRNKKNADLTEIAFGDDGLGMSANILGKCLQLGFSDRYNDREGIGRFGVGMTLGAITQCTRIEVYSKPKGGGWNFTYIDLDALRNQEDPEIPVPKPAEVPREYADLIGEIGTLVIWKNWDREDAKIDEIKSWIARVYRKFIGVEIIKDDKIIPNPTPVHIFIIDGTEVEIHAMDPLYVTKTEFDPEVTKLDKSITLKEEIHKFDKPPKNPHGFKEITIRISLLPESWRSARGLGNSTENRRRRVSGNEGISILRNDREVFYGHIPYYQITDEHSSHYKGFIDLDRYWGCEISFNGDMDYWFSVKNIKTGARPIPELRVKIQEILNETIRSFRKEIRDTWARNEAEKRKKTGDSFSNTEPAEGVISGQSGSISETPPDAGTLDDLIKQSGAEKDEEKKELELKLTGNPVVFRKTSQMDSRGNFMDATTRGSRTIVNINMNHPFFRKFYNLMKLLPSIDTKEKNEEQKTFSQSIETNMLLFLGSFILARREIRPEISQPANDVMDKLIHNWTYFLEKCAKVTLEE